MRASERAAKSRPTSPDAPTSPKPPRSSRTARSWWAGRAGIDGAADPDVGLVRYRGDGGLDPGFGGGGVVLIDLSGGAWDEASDIAIASEGGILVAVQAIVGTTFDFELARFRPDGTLDTSFGTQGVATTAFGAGHECARAISLQADGRIVVVGQASSATVPAFGMGRYLADGSHDPPLRR